MTLKFKQEPYDYYSFNLYHSWARPERKLHRIKTFLAVPVLSLVFVSLEYLTADAAYGYKSVLNLALLLGFVSIGYILVVGGLVKLLIERNTNKLLKAGENTDFMGDKEFTFNNDKILATTLNSKSEMNWEIIEKLREDVNYFFIYISSVSAVVIPKSQVDDQDEFRKMVETKTQTATANMV